MNWYQIKRTDGTVEYVQATSVTDARTKVWSATNAVDKVYKVDVSKVPEKWLTGATPTPTTPTTPTPTTPTPTTPTPTTPPTGGAATSPVSPELEGIITDAVRFLGGWGMGMTTVSGDQTVLTPAGQSFISTVMTYAQREGVTATAAQIRMVIDYQDYLAFQKDNPFMPVPENVNDYSLHYEQWIENTSLYQMGYTQEQIDNYDRFSAFASQYGDLDDYRPQTLEDFLTNYDKAQQQLDTWVQEAGPEAAGFTDDQVREYYAFRDYQSAYGEPGEWKPVDIGDFFGNYETAQQQLSVWQGQAADIEKYEIDPAEKLRRQEESYAESRIAAGERYRETPQYQPPFTQWLGEQGQFSGAFEQFVEGQYPSLRSKFQATQPRLTGFPTPGAARTEAARREQAWQGWLGGRTPELEQEYWGQRPEQRGERLWMQSPGLRTANW